MVDGFNVDELMQALDTIGQTNGQLTGLAQKIQGLDKLSEQLKQGILEAENPLQVLANYETLRKGLELYGKSVDDLLAGAGSDPPLDAYLNGYVLGSGDDAKPIVGVVASYGKVIEGYGKALETAYQYGLMQATYNSARARTQQAELDKIIAAARKAHG